MGVFGLRIGCPLCARAERPNATWQADHTQLDILVLDANGQPKRPWLTTVIDDYSRIVAGYTVFLGAPSTLQTCLALRQAIWRKEDPAWPVCGIPEVLYVDHGCDFTSHHLEQVAADLKIQLVHSAVARPQGRGKVERLFGTLNTELLCDLPGYLVDGKPATAPRLSLSALDAAIGAHIIGNYNAREHQEIDAIPRVAWLGNGWVPRIPQSLESLDLLLIEVATARIVRRDGIHFEGLRYLDATLAAYVGESVTVRYDPRDLAEIRVFHHDRFLCRAINQQHSDQTLSLKDIQTARVAHRRALRGQITERVRGMGNFWGPGNTVLPESPIAAPPGAEVRKPALRHIGLCYGAAGVGKTLSARQYANWPEVESLLYDWGLRERSTGKMLAAMNRSRTLFYTPAVSISARVLNRDIHRLLASATACIRPHNERAKLECSFNHMEMVIVDEVERLSTPALEFLRDLFDRSNIGLILIGMQGIDKRLARYPQLYSRVGFAHHYRPLQGNEFTFVLARHWRELGLCLDGADFVDAQAIAAVARITGGNFRLIHRLFVQIERLMDINHLTAITEDVVNAARRMLVIGTAN
jgi:transposase InsO family protein/DNA transposition AAA+ family ATPase